MKQHIRLYQSEVCHSTRSPEWKEVILEMAKMGGWDSEIRIEVWDYDGFSQNDFVCFFFSFETSLIRFNYDS